MGLRDRLDALSFDRIRERTPSVWEPADDADEATPPGEDSAAALDDPAVVGHEADGPGAVPGGDASTLPGDETTDDGGNRTRKVLLGVSLGSGVVAVATAVVWRLLGREDDDEETPETVAPEPPAPEPPATPAPEPERDEGAAALVGLGFAVAVAALRRRLSSPTK